MTGFINTDALDRFLEAEMLLAMVALFQEPAFLARRRRQQKADRDKRYRDKKRAAEREKVMATAARLRAA